MALSLVKVSGQPWGTLWDESGNACTGLLASINTTIYTAADGATVLAPASFITAASTAMGDPAGSLPGYVSVGSWTLTVGAKTYPAEAVSGLSAVKPPTTADAFGTQFQFVAEKNGNDTNDGLSWGTPKASIAAAVAVLTNGGHIYAAPGSYAPAAGLIFDGHHFHGARGAGGTNAAVTINHSFNGDLIEFARGGSISDVALNNTGTYTGAGLRVLSDGTPRAGTIQCNNVTITGSVGFERDVNFDGSADSTAGGPGVRQVFFNNCMFFGCRTAGETVRVSRGIHVYYSNCEIIQAPEGAITQGLKILDAQTEAFHWTGGYILGDVSCAAAGPMGATIRADVTGNVTFEATSANSAFDGRCGGTYTNLGAASNQAPRQPAPGAGVKRTTNQSIATATQTMIVWETERWDTDTLYTLATDATKFTVKTPGRYAITASVAFATNTTGVRSLYILKNGGIVAGDRRPASTSAESMLSVAGTLDLVATDYVQIAVLQDSGGALNVAATSGDYGCSAAIAKV